MTKKTTVRLSLSEDAIKDLKKKAIDEGLTLSEYVKTISSKQPTQRQKLVDEMNIAMEKLNREIENHPEQDLVVFLHQSINMHADDSTLRKIINDINTQIKHLKKR